MWQNVKFYVIAFALVLTANLITTGLNLLENLFPEIHPLNQIITSLSGVTLGGVIMVLGLLRDSRLDDERKRTKSAEEAAKSAQEEVKSAQQDAKSAQREAKSAQNEAKSAQQEAKQQRIRAERAEAELAHLRAENQFAAVLDRLRRLEELNGISGPDPGKPENRGE